MQFFNWLRKPTSKIGADSVRDKLTDSSPMLIILCFIISLILFGIIKYHYQVSLFKVISRDATISMWLALLFAAVVQIARMAFGFVGVRDLSRDRWFIGGLGVIASIAITYFEHTEVSRMVEHWQEPHLQIPLIALVWGSFLLELRLIGTMIGEDDSEQEYQEQLRKLQEAEENRLEGLEKQLRVQFDRELNYRVKELDMQYAEKRSVDRLESMRQQEQELRDRIDNLTSYIKQPKKHTGNGQLNGQPA